MSHEVYNLISNCRPKSRDRLNILILYPSILQRVSLAASRHKFFVFHNPNDKDMVGLPDNFFAVKDDSLTGNPLYFTSIDFLIYTHGHIQDYAMEYKKRLLIPTVRIMEPPKTNIKTTADFKIFISQNFKDECKEDGMVINFYDQKNINAFDEECYKIC